MPGHRIFFFGSLFFLFGIMLKSFGWNVGIVTIAVLTSVAFLVLFFLTQRKEFLLLLPLLLFLFAGALYYQWDDNKLEKLAVPEEERVFVGIVESNPKFGVNDQNFKLKLVDGLESSVLVSTYRYPTYDYGDRLEITGEVETDIDEGYKNYLEKRGMVGVIYQPNINKLAKEGGNALRGILYKLRNSAYASFTKVFPPTEASFINGLTFGGYNGFTEKFKEAMSKSGTTHLVALSGYNVSILIWILMSFFLYFVSRNTSLVLVFLSLIAFVVMTGAEASVVRAAIMGSLSVLAVHFGRIYDVKNSLMLAALLMVLFNPKVLVFDVGFQLSFLAVLGILYLRPVLYRVFNMKPSRSFLNWRENLMVTASAQLAVAPILISSFGSFSPVSLLTNVLILEFIPVTMFLGFFILFFFLVFSPLAFVLGWLTHILLSIEVGIVRFFGSMDFLIDINMGWIGIAAYYGILAFGVYWLENNKELSLSHA